MTLNQNDPIVIWPVQSQIKKYTNLIYNNNITNNKKIVYKNITEVYIYYLWLYLFLDSFKGLNIFFN